MGNVLFIISTAVANNQTACARTKKNVKNP